MRELKTDLEVIKNDLTYIRQFIEELKDKQEKTEQTATALDQRLTDHIGKVKGFGILLGLSMVGMRIWDAMKLP